MIYAYITHVGIYNTHKYICLYVYTYMCAYTHTYIHVCTNTRSSNVSGNLHGSSLSRILLHAIGNVISVGTKQIMYHFL